MATLFIDLRTEFDRTEFRLIEVHLIKRLTRKRPQEIYVEFAPTPGRGDLRAGARVTEVNDLRTDRNYFLVLRLLNARGVSIGMATSLISLRDDLIVTMVIPR